MQGYLYDDGCQEDFRPKAVESKNDMKSSSSSPLKEIKIFGRKHFTAFMTK